MNLIEVNEDKVAELIETMVCEQVAEEVSSVSVESIAETMIDQAVDDIDFTGIAESMCDSYAESAVDDMVEACVYNAVREKFNEAYNDGNLDFQELIREGIQQYIDYSLKVNIERAVSEHFDTAAKAALMNEERRIKATRDQINTVLRDQGYGTISMNANEKESNESNS